MDYKALAATATRMIKSYGRKAVLTRKAQGTYSAGKVAQGEAIDYPITIVTLDYSSREIDGSNIIAGDVRAYVDAAGVAPIIGDVLTIDGAKWRLIQPKPLNPGGIAIFYELQLRRYVGTFADSVSQFVLKVEQQSDHVVSAVAIELLNRVVLRSPVGNPELWAANADATQWNRGAADVNAELRLNPANLTKAGRLKRGKKVQNRKLSAGEGYVGGRFRGNWQVTVGTRPTAPVDLIDASGGPTIARGAAALAGFKAGIDIFLTNNVPYSVRLENGWSSQAPAGVVRVTVAEFQQIVDEVVRGMPT